MRTRELIIGMRTELTQEIRDLRTEMRAEIGALRGEMVGLRRHFDTHRHDD